MGRALDAYEQRENPQEDIIFSTTPDGTRSVGRPKLRWEDGVVQDTRIVGVKNWKKAALNRDEWAKLLKKAKVYQGLSSQ
jgi:hypothetical protein